MDIGPGRTGTEAQRRLRQGRHQFPELELPDLTRPRTRGIELKRKPSGSWSGQVRATEQLRCRRVTARPTAERRRSPSTASIEKMFSPTELIHCPRRGRSSRRGGRGHRQRSAASPFPPVKSSLEGGEVVYVAGLPSPIRRPGHDCASDSAEVVAEPAVLGAAEELERQSLVRHAGPISNSRSAKKESRRACARASGPSGGYVFALCA